MNNLLKRAKVDRVFRKQLITKLSSQFSPYQPKTKVSLDSIKKLDENSLEIMGRVQVNGSEILYLATIEKAKDGKRFHVYTKNLFLDYFLTGFFNSSPIYFNLLDHFK